MSASSKRASRGFTVAEMLAVIVILGIFTTFIVAIIGPVINAPSKEQAKVNTLQAAGQGLYDMQRDLRMGGITGVYACTGTGAAITCSQPSASTNATSLVIVSPLSSGQLTWSLATPTAGLPAWQGVVVYWLTPDTKGTSNDLERGFVSSTTLGSLAAGPLGSFATTAASAVQHAQAAGGTTAAHEVNTLSVSIDTTKHMVGLAMTAQSSEGSAVNSTSYASNTYTRN